MKTHATLDFHAHVLAAAEELKPLPQSAVRLAGIVAESDSTIDDFAEIIRGDAGLVTALLREANSAMSATRDGIDTIEGALVRLGTARAVAIAVGPSLDETCRTDLDGYGLNAVAFWDHARAASYAAEVVIDLSAVELGANVVTAALIHDLGKVVLSPLLTLSHLEAAMEDCGCSAAAERLLVDIDHAELGAMLAEHWKLPPSIVEAVRGHHLIDSGETDEAVGVHIADLVAHSIIETEPNSTHDGSQYQRSLERLGLDSRELLEKCADRLGRVGFDTSRRGHSPPWLGPTTERKVT